MTSLHRRSHYNKDNIYSCLKLLTLERLKLVEHLLDNDISLREEKVQKVEPKVKKEFDKIVDKLVINCLNMKGKVVS